MCLGDLSGVKAIYSTKYAFRCPEGRRHGGRRGVIQSYGGSGVPSGSERRKGHLFY